MRVIHAFIALLAASCAACAFSTAPFDDASECSAAGDKGIPATPAQMLRRLASAVRDESLLDAGSYTAANLACVFGRYTFTAQASPIADVQMGFQDAGHDIESGFVSLRLPKDGRTAFSLAAIVRAPGTHLPIQRVIDVLGQPSRVVDATPRPGHSQWPVTREPQGLETAMVVFDITSSAYSSRIWVMTDRNGMVTLIRASGERGR